MVSAKGKQICKAIGFFVLLAAVLLGLSFGLSTKKQGRYAGSRAHEINLIFNEPENSLDVLFVGHSGVYGGISPMELYAQDGITSFDCSQSLQLPRESQRFIEDVLTAQTPRVIVLEVDQFFYDNVPSKYAKGRAVRNKFPLLERHVLWKTGFRNKERNITKGYRYTDICQPYTGNKKWKPADETYKLTPQYAQTLNGIADLCREKNIALFLLELPSKTVWDGSKYNAIRTFADEHKLPFTDLNQCEEQLGLDWQTDTRDRGNHLNYFGAVKVSRYVSKLLKERYDLPDRKGDPAYKTWEVDYAAYKKIVEKNPCAE